MTQTPPYQVTDPATGEVAETFPFATDAEVAAALAAAGQCRRDITYQHRFGFEQALLDQARPGGRSSASREPALPWHEAVAIAFEQ